MNRRDFLKLGTLLSSAALLQFNTASTLVRQMAQVAVNGKLYRGTVDGRIYVSHNNGKSWAQHTDFGEQLGIASLFSDPHDRVHAQLEFRSRSFELALDDDGKTWRTV